MPAVSQIIIYPIKSLPGISVNQWPLVKTGLLYDRCWMLVDAQGEFLSQRRLSKMALIQTQIKDDHLWLQAEGYHPISMPLLPANGALIDIKVWEYSGQGQTVSESLNHWFSQVLDHPCQLVYHPDHQTRQVDPDYAFNTDQTAYSDGFPLLIASEASLADFNHKSGLNLDMRRFRTNLVVTECGAFAEDRWRKIRINGINFRLPKPCSRCAIPSIDPDSGESQKAVLTALANWRKHNNKVYFGQNAIHDSLGSISVGDNVEILSEAEPQPPLA